MVTSAERLKTLQALSAVLENLTNEVSEALIAWKATISQPTALGKYAAVAYRERERQAYRTVDALIAQVDDVNGQLLEYWRSQQ
jgi:hypothetical protein